MKKSTKALIGILVCVIVLAGAVVLLKVTEGVRGGEDASSQTSSQTTDLIGKEEEDIASILVTNEHGSYTIKPQEKEMEETSYYIEELHGFVVNKMCIRDRVSSTPSISKCPLYCRLTLRTLFISWESPSSA